MDLDEKDIGMGGTDDTASNFSVGTRTSIAFTDASDGKSTKSDRNAAERLRKKLRRKRAPVKSRQWLLQKKRASSKAWKEDTGRF